MDYKNIIAYAMCLVVGFIIGHLFRKSPANDEQARQKNLENELLNSQNESTRLITENKARDARLAIIENEKTELVLLNKELTTKAETHQERLTELHKCITDISRQDAEKDAKILSMVQVNTQLETSLKKDKEMFDEQIKTLAAAKQQLNEEFKNTARQIFEERSKNFKELNNESVQKILEPFSKDMQALKERVENVHTEETKQRSSLEEQVKNLTLVNKHMSEEATRLTNALKGDNKAQGNWGELVLERVLELSGLIKGESFEVQGTYIDDEGKQKRPDVVVFLPENKQIIIDSKVSLLAYEKAYSALDDDARELAMKAHASSVRSHINELARKEYHALSGVNSQEYVLMFIPIESAYSMAMMADPTLYEYALKKKIIIVCPSTLLISLRTIDSIWRYEKQNKNALTIADEAGKMLDKLEKVLKLYTLVGDNLKVAQKNYEEGLKVLSTGNGNLIKKAASLRDLGVKTKINIEKHKQKLLALEE